ncbi:MAG: hypothetical protein K2L48_01810 [Mycoplasmoidaceae bacterium]|nr:hypothetical protein [Mycoplasmoidaceae bacterium]
MPSTNVSFELSLGIEDSVVPSSYKTVVSVNVLFLIIETFVVSSPIEISLGE